MDGGSPTDQRERNKSHIEKWGGVLVADLEVPGQSRSYIEYEEAKREIEAYRQLDALIKEQSFDVLICYNVGRLGRKRSLITTVIDLCYEAGIMVYRTSSPPAGLEWSKRGYSDLLLEAIESATFQNEVDQFREHHKTGMIRRAKRGLMAGNIPYGYLADPPRSKEYKLIVDEHSANAVRRAFDLFLSGLGMLKIAEILNTEGFRSPGAIRKYRNERTPRSWSGEGVRAVIERCWVYAGYAEINRDSKDRTFHREKSDHIPPIIDEETLQRLDTEIKLRKRANPPKGNHLFSGICVCTQCNRRMTVYLRKQKRLPCASCPSCHRIVNYRIITQTLLSFFDSLDEGYEIETDSNADGAELDIEAERIQLQLTAIPDAEKRAYEAFVDGDVDKSAYQAQKKRLELRKRDLQDSLQASDLKRARHRNSEALQKQYETIAELGRDMLEIGAEKPKEVNQWLREYIRIDFAADRTLTVRVI